MKVREDLVPQLRELIILRCHALDFPSLSPNPIRISIRYHNSSVQRAVCLSLDFYCCDKTRQLTTAREKGLVRLTLPHHNPLCEEVRAGTQGNPEFGTEAEAI